MYLVKGKDLRYVAKEKQVEKLIALGYVEADQDVVIRIKGLDITDDSEEVKAKPKK